MGQEGGGEDGIGEKGILACQCEKDRKANWPAEGVECRKSKFVKIQPIPSNLGKMKTSE